MSRSRKAPRLSLVRVLACSALAAVSSIGFSSSAMAINQPSPSGTDTVKITVPMHQVPKSRATGGATPNVVVPGDCGTAFLYVSRTGVGAAHLDYGFYNLSSASIWVNANAGMVNLDGPGTAADSYSRPQWYSRSWERQVNLDAGYSGEYQVTVG